MKNKRIMGIVLSIIAGIISLILLIIFVKGENQKAAILNTGYMIEHDGEIVENVRFNDYFFDANYNDEYTIKRKMPNIEKTNMYFSFITYFAEVKVYLEDKLIYSYGNGDDSYSGTHYIELPNNYKNKELKIYIRSTADKAFVDLEPPRFDTEYKVRTDAVHKNMLVFQISISLVIIGIVVLLLSIYSSVVQGKLIKLFFLALLCISIGSWALAYTRTIQFISSDLHFNTVLEYISVYFVGVALLGFYFDFPIKKSSRLLSIAFVFNCLFFLAAVIIMFIDDTYLALLVTPFHINAGVTLFILLSNSAKKLKNGKLIDKITIIGISLVCVCGLIDLGMFYNYNGGVYIIYPLFPIAAFIYLVLLMVGYINEVNRLNTESVKRRLLMKLAYSDTLTGINNRSKFNLDCKKYCESKDNRSLIVFDLNGLKKVNDNFGHLKGDELLRIFSQKLCYYFDKDDCYRVGGDEFFIMTSESDLNRLLNKFVEDEIFLSVSNEKIRITASFGFARLRDYAYDFEKTIKAADEKMYSMKFNTNNCRE